MKSPLTVEDVIKYLEFRSYGLQCSVAKKEFEFILRLLDMVTEYQLENNEKANEFEIEVE
jgi:hypothetical protein